MESPKVIVLNNFRHRKKVASFDYDWTLVKPKSGGTFPKDVNDWEWLRKDIPKIIKSYYEKGYSILIFTNQSKVWKVDQIRNVLKTLDIPCYISIATDKQHYKPSKLMFNRYNERYGKDRYDKKSFYCGDALGRVNDWANTDKLFAESIGFKVKSPEEIFPFVKEKEKSLDNVLTQEIIIMIGYPGSGKSTIANKFDKSKYMIISGDIYKTVKKMIKVSEEYIKSGKSIIFDATNGTQKKRKEYIDYANSLNIPVRCIHVNTSLEEALARNNTREKPVPKIVYFKYRKEFELPNENEGCKVITVLK